MICVEMLPAERGDCILIEYGAGTTLTNRVLIDGGPVNSDLYEGVRNRLLKVPVSSDGRRHFELLVVTHVDTDHIEGVIKILQDTELACSFDDIWFNGWKQIEHLDPVHTLGPKQGEFLGALITKQERPWNNHFDGNAILTDGADLPECKLQGGLKLTILSPTLKDLEKLAKAWAKVMKAAGFDPGDTETVLEKFESKWWARPHVPVLGLSGPIQPSADPSEANGSSIAFLAEYDGYSLLMAGDAKDDVLTAALRTLRSQRNLDGRLPVDAFKLSHHGSKNNTTPQLLKELAADYYLVSTNGNRFDHPDALVIKSIIKNHHGEKPVVCFNYEQPQTLLWRGKPDIETHYGSDARVCLPAEDQRPV